MGTRVGMLRSPMPQLAATSASDPSTDATRTLRDPRGTSSILAHGAHREGSGRVQLPFEPVQSQGLLDDLDARGLVHDHTDRDALAARLEQGPIGLYCGLDPTGP